MIWYVEETKRKYPTVIPFHGISLTGMLRKTFGIDELLCCFDVKVLVCKAMKMFKCWRPKKKSAWTDLDRVDFEKISSKSQCLNRKIGVFKVARRSALGTRRSSFGARRSALGKIKKGLFSGKCL